MEVSYLDECMQAYKLRKYVNYGDKELCIEHEDMNERIFKI